MKVTVKARRTRGCVSVAMASAFALVCGASACSDASEQDEIAEQTEVDLDVAEIQAGRPESGYRAVGLVSSGGVSDGFCSGTLVDESWIMTANHCKEAEFFSIGTDSSNFVPHELDAKRFNHPGGDMVLMHLRQPIRDVRPMKLYDGPAPRVGKKCVAVGFGAHTDDAGVTTRGRKRSGISPVTSVADHAILTRGGTGYVDAGDSGGALVCDNKLTGVTRYKDTNIGGNFGRVDAAWIKKTIADNTPWKEDP